MATRTQQLIDDLNFARDARTRSYPADADVLTFWLGDDEDTEVSIPIPDHGYRWAVCPLCDGNGKHVNPAIDAGGLSAEDFHDDPDFAEDYFSGRYNVTCAQCDGRTTVRVVEPERFLDADLLAAYRRYHGEQARMDAEIEEERLAEIRCGA